MLDLEEITMFAKETDLTYHNAENGPEDEQWRIAINELKSHAENETWKIAQLPSECKLLTYNAY